MQYNHIVIGFLPDTNYKHKELKEALDHIQQYGNINKHSADSFAERGDTLRNKMEILDDFFLSILKEVEKKLRDRK